MIFVTITDEAQRARGLLCNENKRAFDCSEDKDKLIRDNAVSRLLQSHDIVRLQ